MSSGIYKRTKKNCVFFNSKVQSELGIRSAKKNKKNNTGIFSKKSHKKAQITNKKNKTSIYGLTLKQKREIAKKGNKTNKKNNTGLYSITHEQRVKNGKKFGKKTFKLHPNQARENGLKAVETLRLHSKNIWDGINFRSNQEMLKAKKILTKPIISVNCNVKVGNFYFDFFPQSYDKMYQGKFVEFHCFGKDSKEIKAIYKRNLTKEQYFNQRRKVLDDNGYKDYELVVIP